jgi:hypothetical protein
MHADGVSQRAPITFDGNLHDVSMLQTNVIAETQAVRSKEVYVDVSPAAVSFIFEMMVLDVLQAMAHFGFTAAESFGPMDISFPFDGHGYRHGFEFRINHKFWPKRTGAEFGASEIKVVLLLELMIREFVAYSHSDSIGPAIWSYEVDAGDLSFLSTILSVGRNIERFSVGA